MLMAIQDSEDMIIPATRCPPFSSFPEPSSMLKRLLEDRIVVTLKTHVPIPTIMMDAQPEAQPFEHSDVQNRTEEPSIEPKRNDRYFLNEDPMVVFQVENQLFRVHQYHLARESKRFREMFAESDEARNIGQSIHLPGVTVVEFESLLDYFYKPRAESGTLQDHLDLLSVSHECQVPEAFQFAKTTLDQFQNQPQLQPLQKLVLGNRYCFTDWVTSASDTLLVREETLSVEEATALGFDGLASFVKAREERLENKIREVENRVSKPKRRRERMF